MATKEIETKSVKKLIQFPFETHRNSFTDDYDLSSEILGEGINGKVRKCSNRQTGKIFALKILKDTNRSRQEILIHKKASENCPFIVQIIDIYENVYKKERSLLIIMECMEGGDLFTQIENRSEDSFREVEAARYISMIVEAVHHLHNQDIAHRDLKPENILLTDKTNNAKVKIADFGFAKEGHYQSQPFHTPLYTPYYVPPEILSNNYYDKACDIWSMGVITYILLCGFPPFYSKTDSVLSPGMKDRIKAGEYSFDYPQWENVSQEAKSILKQMLTVDPTKRITIEQIRQSSWINQLTSERPIDMSLLDDQQTKFQLETAVINAIDDQRRTDEDDRDYSIEIQLAGPESSKLGKKAAKLQSQSSNK